MVFQSFDGKEIFVHEWLEVENPKGIVQIVHGMAEHALRYEKFARFLNEQGFLVVADDHRGHGKTDENTLGYCKKDMFVSTVQDEGELTKYYRAKYPTLPFILLGFSYGSFIAQSYLSRFGNLIDGAILAGSNHKKDFEVSLGALITGTACAFGCEKKPSKLVEKLSFGAYKKQFQDRQWLSIDQENNLAYYQDALCAFRCSHRFYRDFFRGLKSLYTKKYIAGLNKKTPLLIASGEYDAVGEQGKGVQRLYRFYKEKAGMENVTLKLFKNSRHEFLNEKENRDEKWGTLLDFIQKNCN